MTHLQRLRELFDALLDVPAERWDEWLDEHEVDTVTRSELRRLAADEAQSGPLDQTLGALLSVVPSESALSHLIGQRIGAFRILRRLGEGGMASVFLAQREGADFEQEVALKLLKRGALSEVEQNFFRRERQVLARLSHPGIARLIDGGVSEEGVAYLAMEFVDGVSITQWCHDRELGIEARVALICKVARAAAAAHAALVVHRDIKPSNVLVTASGEPVLLDFGIAKILHDDEGEHTRTGVVPMTPQYAAPEQLQGGIITTATDVYALGLLLFEVLTGQRLDRGKRQPPSAIANARSSSGASATTRLRIDRDLDRVVLKALSEEPGLRYPGAEALADDLDRYLSRQPVRAHPPSAWYRTRKFVERHRGGVAVTVLLILSVFASLAYSVWQARLARAEAMRAERVSGFLVELFEAAGQSLPRDQRPTPASIVREAGARLKAETALDADTRASLLVTLANVSELAGEYERALALADDAEQALGLEAGGRPGIRRQILIERAQSLQALGRAPQAKALLGPWHAQFLEGNGDLAIEGLATLASLEVETGALEAAVERAREAANLAERLHGPDSREALLMQLGVGDVLGLAGKQAESIVLRERTLARWREVAVPFDRYYVNTVLNLASDRVKQGDLDTAEAETRQALELLRGIYDGPHDAIANALQNLGGLLQHRGRDDEARPYIEQAAQMFETLFGPDHMQVASAHDALATLHIGGRDFVGAAQTLERVTGICERGKYDTSNPACGRAWQNLSYAYLMQGRLDDAAVANERSAELRRTLHGENSPEFARTLSGLAAIRVRQSRFAEAADTVRRALAIVEQAGLGDAPEASSMHGTLARALRETGQPQEALVALERAEVHWKKNSPDDRDRQLRMLLLRIDVLGDLGRRSEARDAARRALEGDFSEAVLSREEWQRVRQAAR